ncbi:hypothetical protein [Paenibacillus sp. P3E]|uniref:hypothetical protein n=1 Tax=Paenibacillus sp. P3E TaxID=1349435 RepID=UPI0009F9FF4E|nr:hypothetical protein [Paenibacillus sp. P3E]
MIENLKEAIDEINEQIEGDFNPSDWSGGDFDDCYDLGYGHGKKLGRIVAFRKVLVLLEGSAESI